MAAIKNERALSEVIGFILLLGVIVAAFSLWITYVIPADGREKEIDQMNAVKDRFTDYKISTDSLWVNNQSGVTLSTSFNLGTGGGNTEAGGLFLPLLQPQASSATLTVSDNGDKLNITRSSTSLASLYNMSTLSYQSENYYWIQQKYYYQLGGVFLSQETGTANRISPAISIVGNSDNTITVTVVPIELLGGGSIGGNGPVRIDTRLKNLQDPVLLEPNTYVNISVDNVADKATALMWMNSVFNETRIRGGVINPAYYTFGVAETPVTKRASAFINIVGPAGGSTNDVYLTVRPVEYVVTLNNIASGLN
jgi:hypothetical protein